MSEAVESIVASNMAMSATSSDCARVPTEATIEATRGSLTATFALNNDPKDMDVTPEPDMPKTRRLCRHLQPRRPRLIQLKNFHTWVRRAMVSPSRLMAKTFRSPRIPGGTGSFLT